MHVAFVLLRDEVSMQQAQDRFPLFYCDCVPSLEDGDATHAIAADDRDHTWLTVLRHAPPKPIVITALVVDRPEGLTGMRAFLEHFVAHCRRGPCLCVGGAHTVVHTGPGVSYDALLRALDMIG